MKNSEKLENSTLFTSFWQQWFAEPALNKRRQGLAGTRFNYSWRAEASSTSASGTPSVVAVAMAGVLVAVAVLGAGAVAVAGLYFYILICHILFTI